MDKIGMEGVAKELAESGFDQAAIDKYLAMFEALSKEEDGISYLGKVLGGHLEEGAAEGLKEIVDSVEAVSYTHLVFHAVAAE